MTDAAEADAPHAVLLTLAQAPPEKQPQLAQQIAFEWARRDINAMWNTVSRSNLGAQIKQIIFNELWG